MNVNERISASKSPFRPLVNETLCQMDANANFQDVPSASSTQFKPIVDETLARLQECRLAFAPLLDDAIGFGGAAGDNDLVELWHKNAVKLVLKAEDAVGTAAEYICDAHIALQHVSVRFATPEAKWDAAARQFITQHAESLAETDRDVVVSRDDLISTPARGNAAVLNRCFSAAESLLIRLRDWTREHGVEVAWVAAASGNRLALSEIAEAQRFIELAWMHLQSAKRKATTAEGEAVYYRRETSC